MPLIQSNLRYRLYALALVFPISLAGIGFMIGYYLHNYSTAIIFCALGILSGLLIDFICYYRKLFTIAIYKAPLPASLFFLIWWITSSFLNLLPSFIISVAGLAIGLWLNSILIEPYQFFRIKKGVLAIIYGMFSLFLMGFFMGIPAFNLLLGLLAGNYLSIRIVSNYKHEPRIKKTLIQGALFTSAVQFLITIIATWLAMSDYDNSLLIAQKLLPFTVSSQNFLWILIIIGIVTVVLQYYITIFTAKTMLQLWKHKRFGRYLKLKI